MNSLGEFSKEFVEYHAFKTLKERKLRNMEARSKRSHRFRRDEMETIIKGVGINSKQKSFFHDTLISNSRYFT